VPTIEPAAEEGAVEVDGQHAAPRFVGLGDGEVEVGGDGAAAGDLLCLREHAAAEVLSAGGVALETADARVVHQDVEPAVRLAHPIEHRGHGRGVRDVGPDPDPLELCGRLLRVLFPEVVDDDLRALLAKALGDGPAESARRSGDERHPSVESVHLLLLRVPA
jgi:hypothetical protein